MIIPQKVKIGADILEVKQIAGLLDKSDCYGQNIPHEQLIELEKNMSPTFKQQIFLHEIIEHLDEQHNYELPHNIIWSLASCLTQLINDNSEVFVKNEV